MKTNTSDYTTVIVLLQKNESLIFMSKKMTAIEQNYGITKKEILTIIQEIKQQRKYFEETKRTTTIITDYKNLKYFKNTKITNQRQIQQILEIQDILYQI